jgi:hypothetical protein
MVGSSEESPRRTASRRRVLQVCGGLAAGGLAGCSQSSSDPATAPATDSPTATATETPTPTATPSPTPIQQPYRVDLQPANQANADMAMFQYSTERGWDDMEVDLERLDEWHENDFKEFGESKFVNNIEDGFENRKTDPVEGGFPNYKDEDTPPLGEFIYSEFTGASDFQEAFNWISPLWYSYANDEFGQIHSTQQYTMGITIEEAIEKHVGLEAHGWGFDSPVIDVGGNHGQVMFFNKSTNNLYLAETTPDKTGQFRARSPSESPYNPKNNHRVLEEVWHPLWYRGKAPDVDRVDYERAKSAATIMLVSMVTQDIEENKNGESRLAITDQYIESVLNVMRAGEMPGEIYDQLKITERWIMTDGRKADIILYGDMDDPRYAVGSSDEVGQLIKEIETTEQTYTIDDVESRLDVGT